MGGMDGYQGLNKHGGGMNEHEWVQEECRGYGQVPGGSNGHRGWYEQAQAGARGVQYGQVPGG